LRAGSRRFKLVSNPTCGGAQMPVRSAGDSPATTPLEAADGHRPSVAPSAEASPDLGQARRVVALLGVLSIGALWLQHHLGFELEQLGVVALAGAVWGGIGELATVFGDDAGIGKAVDTVFKTPIRGLLLFLARRRPFALLTGLLVLAMATLSSVTIRSDAPGEETSVSLATLDKDGTPRRSKLTADEPVARFRPVLTSPFGRLYRVRADGYLPAQINVFPLVGRQVLLGRDLVTSPSVLFRPFAEGISALGDSAVFSVKRIRARKEELIAVDTGSGSASAFLLGRPKPVSDAMMMLWNLEVTASKATDEIKAKMLMLWRSPKQLTLRSELAPRDCLVAEIRLHDQLRARGIAMLSDAPLVDVLMQDVTSATGKMPSC
jgi:hypothetical protein